MDAKLNYLETLLRNTNGAIVAFSAGVDSTFLLKIAYSVLGERAIALTARSPTVPPGEFEAAKEFVKTLGCRHIVIDSNELANPSFAQNPSNRCFFCKDELFSVITDELVAEHRLDAVAYTDHPSSRRPCQSQPRAQGKVRTEDHRPEGGVTVL